MATPPVADDFLKLLCAEGLTVVEVGRWQTHDRNHKGPWGPQVHGVMIHHTVTKGTDTTVRICRNGYEGLPGPLCHGVIAKDGTVHLVGYGRTNHAGLGDDDVLRAVMGETAPPKANEANTDGNRAFYGFECENLGDGKDPWPKEQLEAIERVSAAICRYHRWGPRSVIRHLDWQPGKVDPRGVDWTAMQDRIGDRLAVPVPKPPAAEKPPATKPGTKPPAAKPVPKPPVVDLSKLVAAAKTDPPKPGTPVSYYGVKTVESALVAEGLLARSLADGHFGSATRTAYASWQRRCGYSGKDADGLPGAESLKKLAARRGFTVTA